MEFDSRVLNRNYQKLCWDGLELMHKKVLMTAEIATKINKFSRDFQKILEEIERKSKETPLNTEEISKLHQKLQELKLEWEQLNQNLNIIPIKK